MAFEVEKMRTNLQKFKQREILNDEKYLEIVKQASPRRIMDNSKTAQLLLDQIKELKEENAQLQKS